MDHNNQNHFIRFLIATDVHLGHSQNNDILREDSYDAFSQVLKLANSHDVDFLLLGGDLFDEINPSKRCLYKCLNLLKSNIFGQKKISIKVTGIQPNFSNQNINISLPIFTIHGNHDYPSNDFGKLSVCDLLHASNLVNYFGKYLMPSTKKILIQPLIFSKEGAQNKLAIYGLGYHKDLRLHQLFRKGQVQFLQLQDPDRYTKIFIFHQNRYKGKKGGVGASYENCILPEQIPQWIDLTIWGHQHEAIKKIEIQSDRKIYQPGSTVITSYIEAEAGIKQAVLVTIPLKLIKRQDKFKLQSLQLRESYRPFFYKSYILEQIIRNHEGQKLDFQLFFGKEIEKVLSQNPKKPIIRFKIDHTGFEIMRLRNLQEKYKDHVANKFKIFTFHQKKIKKSKHSDELDDGAILNMIQNKKVYRDAVKQKSLSSQLYDVYDEEMQHNPLKFFDPNKLKQKISQAANREDRNPTNQIRQFYEDMMYKKTEEGKKNIKKFKKEQKEKFMKVREHILQKINCNLRGELDEVQGYDYSTKIKQYKLDYLQHQKIYEEGINSRKSKNVSDNSVSQNEEDCCKKAQKQEYHENITVQNYKQAQQMLGKNNKKKKSAKQVSFSDLSQ